MIEFVRLTPLDSEKISILEKELYPSRLRLGREDIQENLRIFEEEKQNFSAGAKKDEDLIGYITAWPSESLAEGHENEAIIYVDDLAVLPGYKEHLFNILVKFIQQIQGSEFKDNAVETMAPMDVYQMLNRHKQALNRLGYEIVNHQDFYDDELDEDLVWIRLLPV